MEEQTQINNILSNVKPIQMSVNDIEQSKTADKCCLCHKPFTLYDQTYERRVYHHCHVTGQYIGMAHNSCNLNSKQSKEIRVVFHNLKGFDMHFIALASGKFKNQKLSCIAQNTERYISFKFPI